MHGRCVSRLVRHCRLFAAADVQDFIELFNDIRQNITFTKIPFSFDRRLIDMGIEPFLITSTLECVIAQRLVRKLCQKCREAYNPDSYIIESLGLAQVDISHKEFYRAQGCSKWPACKTQSRVAQT